MKLFKSIFQEKKFLPSTNIVKDSNGSNVNTYVVSSKVKQSYNIIRESFTKKDINRAFSITGPYGTGKSSFVNYILQELPKDSKLIIKNINIIGEYEPLINTLTRAFIEFEKREKIRFLRKIKDKEITTFDVIEAVYYYNSKYNLLLAIDEFGKNLEYESINNESRNLHLLQNLAEASSRLNDNYLVLITIQHQSIVTYFSTNENKTKTDWAKVQGRFTELSILEDVYQLANNISNYIGSKSNKETKEITNKLNIIKPKNIDLTRIQFEKAYPLHPTALLALPSLAISLGQNGRTMYTYINYRGKNSIIDKMNSDIKIENLVNISDVYDYFDSEIPNQVSTSSSAKIWFEITNKINSYAGDEISLSILKAIGILNVTHSSVKIKANLENILYSFSVDYKSKKGKLYQDKIRKLEKEGYILYRSFAKEYRIWEGSDIDLDKKIRIEKNKINNLSIAETLNKLNNKRIIVGSRNTYETGFYRYFDVIFIDKENLNVIKKTNSSSGVLGFSLDSEIEKEIRKIKLSYNLLVKKKMKVENLSKVSTELLATKNVYEWLDGEKINDKVAKIELENRIEVLTSEFNQELNKYIYGMGKDTLWHLYKPNEVVILENEKSINTIVSNALDHIYNKSPKGIVEHLSRDAITQQGSNGRLLLLKKLLNNSKEYNLGIDGDGPEVAIYRNILTRNNLHKKNNNMYYIDKPSKKNNLYPVWTFIESLLRKENKYTVSEIINKCKAEPYGLKEAYALTLVCIIIIKNISKITIYEDDRYQVDFTESHLERLLKNPKKFKVKIIAENSSEEKLVLSFVDAFNIIKSESNSENLLKLTSYFIKSIRSLPDFTLENIENNKNQKALIIAIRNAVDPIELFTKTIPSIYSEYSKTSNEGVSNIVLSVKEDIEILTKKYNNMLESIENEILTLRGASNYSDFKHRYSESAELVYQSTTDSKLKVFLGSINREFINKNDWLESICLAVSGKIPKTWKIEDRNEFTLMLTKQIKKWINIETLNLNYMGSGGHIISITSLENGEFIFPIVIKDEDYYESIKIYEDLRKQYSESELKSLSGSIIKLLIEKSSNNEIETTKKGKRYE